MADKNVKIEGRSGFAVEITPQGILVKTILLKNDGTWIEAPAVFPSPDYAFDQISLLKQIVAQKFSEAVKMTGEAMSNSSALVKNLQTKK